MQIYHNSALRKVKMQNASPANTDPPFDDPDTPLDYPIDGVLDLHTFRPAEIRELLHDYLAECRRRGILAVRIIHGKGAGVLRRTVHACLTREEGILDFQLADAGGGGWGATLVTLQPSPSDLSGTIL